MMGGSIVPPMVYRWHGQFKIQLILTNSNQLKAVDSNYCSQKLFSYYSAIVSKGLLVGESLCVCLCLSVILPSIFHCSCKFV